MSSQRFLDWHFPLILAGVLAGLLGASCGGADSPDASSPTAPANPANTNFSGTWTGTMTRPAGLGTIEIRWTISQSNEGQLTGPGSLTYNGVTIDALMAATLESSSGAPAVSFFRIDRANATALPRCGIFFPTNSPAFGNITPTSRTLTSTVVAVSYNNCDGFIAPDPPSTNRQETTQMTLNKQ